MVSPQYFFPVENGPINNSSDVSAFLDKPLVTRDIKSYSVPSEENINCIVHAPFSPFDLSYQNEAFKPKDELEEGNKILSDYIDNKLNTLFDEQKAIEIKNQINKIKEFEREFGPQGFEPLHLRPLSKLYEISTADLFFAFALKVLDETKFLQDRTRYLEVHPDLLFFIAGNDISNMQQVSSMLSDVLEKLDTTILIENVLLESERYIREFQWATDIDSLIKIFGTSNPNIGYCIDIDHIAKMQKRKNKDGEPDPYLLERTPENLKFYIDFLTQYKVPVIMHTRDTVQSNDPEWGNLITYAYSKGVPVVYEHKK